jgi:hypothetical protein
VPVDGAFEHVEFEEGRTVTLRGLFGDAHAVISAEAQTWHLAAAYFEQQWSSADPTFAGTTTRYIRGPRQDPHRIRSAVPEGRLIELCQQVDAALARIVRDVPFRTTYRD